MLRSRLFWLVSALLIAAGGLVWEWRSLSTVRPRVAQGPAGLHALVPPHRIATLAPAIRVAVRATPTPAPTAVAPSAMPQLQPSATPVTPESSAPTGVPMLAPDAAPRILGIALSSNVVHPGGVISGTVHTSSNVASVEARVAGYTIALSKIDVGQFALSYRVPQLPPVLLRTYTVDVTAHNTRGDTTSGTVQITIQ